MTPCFHRAPSSRDWSARVGGSRVAAAAFLMLLLTACGAAQEAEDAGPAGIDLPRVGTLGRAPKGPGTIDVRVTAQGRITLDGALVHESHGPLPVVDDGSVS